MYYNFYIYLLLLAIISPFLAFNKESILKTCSITNYIFYTSIVIIIIIGLKKIYEKDSFFININVDTGKKIVLQSLVIIITLFISGIIIIKENVFVYKSLQKSVYLIVLLLYSIYFMKMDINIYMIIGVFLIIGGSYLIDKKQIKYKDKINISIVL
tara:strand:+ start:413 stop:880 length:468 start_codon:yes stop_codon:yes gene_type:complete